MATQPTPILVAKSKRDIRPVPPHGQPPRPDRRGHGDREDRHPAGAGRAVQRHRRPGFYGRCQGRPLGHRPSRRRQPQGGGAGEERWASKDFTFQGFPVVFWDVFGEQGHPGPHHRFRDGAPASQPHPQAQRDPERRPHPGLQDRRRQRPAAPRPEGPAVHAPVRGGQRGDSSRPSTATSPRPASARSSGTFWPSRSKGETLLRRAGPRPRRPDADGFQGEGDRSTSSPPTS